MLYSLFEFINHELGISLLTYSSFRAIISGVMSLCIAIWLGKYFINWMIAHGYYETPREEKEDPDAKKKGKVPTMGGVFVIIAILIPCLLIGKLSNVYMLLMIVTTILMGLLGYADDYIKTIRKNKKGLNGWGKIAGQVLLGLIVALTLRFSPSVTMNEVVNSHIENNTIVVDKSPEIKSTQTTIPFVKHHNFNYADLFKWLGDENMYRAGWIFFVLLTTFVIAAVSNGANLNDGMDGMCAGNSVIIGMALLVLAYMSGSIVWAEYFDVMYIPGSEEIVIFLATFIGALIGFLWWNGFPAQVFLGDTGSLTIGGIIGVCAMIIHKELMLPLLCGIFLIESLSVIIQVGVFKYTKRHGQRVRIWRATPIHDHFRRTLEKARKNDPICKFIFKDDRNIITETKIVLRFCIVTLILATLTILTLKIR